MGAAGTTVVTLQKTVSFPRSHGVLNAPPFQRGAVIAGRQGTSTSSKSPDRKSLTLAGVEQSAPIAYRSRRELQTRRVGEVFLSRRVQPSASLVELVSLLDKSRSELQIG